MQKNDKTLKINTPCLFQSSIRFCDLVGVAIIVDWLKQFLLQSYLNFHFCVESVASTAHGFHSVHTGELIEINS